MKKKEQIVCPNCDSRKSRWVEENKCRVCLRCNREFEDEEKPTTKMEAGKCPNCGSEDLDWGSTLLEGEQLGYYFECNNCDKEGIEWYRLDYIESVMT